MRNDKDDRRSQRTRRALSAALVQLMLRQRYDTITVQDIIDQADVGRSTFYAHYHDKDDLLVSDFATVVDALSDHIHQPHQEDGRHRPSLTPFFAHIQENHQLYKALVSGGGIDLLYKTGHARLRHNIEQHLRELVRSEQPLVAPLPLLADYIAGAILNLLKWWLDHELPYTPAELDQLFARLVLPGLQNVLQIPELAEVSEAL